jgi:hypothetical protein
MYPFVRAYGAYPARVNIRAIWQRAGQARAPTEQ